MSQPGWDETRRYDEPLVGDRVVSERVVSDQVVDPRADALDDQIDADARRVRTVRVVCTIITAVCGLFALILGAHIVLVLANANPANGFASLVDDLSSAVSLGLRDLFTPDNEKARVLLNDAAAALAWLLIGAGLTYLIRRLALPAGPRRTRYRRTAG